MATRWYGAAAPDIRPARLPIYDRASTILLHVPRARAEQWCISVEDAAEVGHPYAMGEQHYRILICRGWKVPLPQLWPQLKRWN